MAHVMISYAHVDADFALKLKSRLEQAGFTVWIDTERLRAGEDWREAIDEAIRSAMVVVVIMTPSSFESKYVTYEWACAWGDGTPVIPIMLEKTALHPRLAVLQYLNFTQYHDWESLIRRLSELRNQAAQRWPGIPADTPNDIIGLLNQLQSPLPEERKLAVESIARHQHYTATSVLIYSLKHPMRDVRIQVLEKLVQIEKFASYEAIPALTELMFDPADRTRELVVHLLNRIGHPAAGKALIRATQDDCRYVRSAAENALRRIGVPRIARFMVEDLLKNSDMGSYREVCELMDLVQYPAEEALEEIILDTTSTLRRAALDLYEAHSTTLAIESLYERLADDVDPFMRQLVFNRAMEAHYTQTLVRFLADDDPERRRKAADKLESLPIVARPAAHIYEDGSPHSIQMHYSVERVRMLYSLLPRVDDATADTILYVLRHGGTTAVKILINDAIIAGDDPDHAARYALDRMGVDDLETFIYLLDSAHLLADPVENSDGISKKQFWTEVAQRIIQIGRDAIPDLLGAAYNPDSSETLRRNAINVMGLIKVPEAFQSLQEIVDDNPALRAYAKRALQRLNPPPQNATSRRWWQRRG